MSRSQEFYMGTSSGSRRELVSATNGFGLRAPVDEESERKRRSEETAYSLRAKRVKTEQDIEEYQNTLASIKLETEEQIMEKDKSDSEEEEESQEEGGVKQEPSEELDPNELLLYQNPDYNFFNVNYDTQLPIFEKRQEIVDAVNGNTVVIIQGTTGCGKTTQVPQYILDDHANRNMRCRIVVTQPRRIAATSVSKRVSAERNWPWGSVCGYKVSMDKRFNEDTRIFYVTTGYLLEYLVANDLELDNIYTHVILDEIHDRDINTDFLLLLLRILLLRKSKLKIILMSATLDPQPLIDYFQNFNNNADIPLVECKMRTYTVKKWYLDKIQNVIEYEAKLEFDINLPEMHDEQLEVLVRLLDYIEKRELESLPADRETVNGFADVRGATLIFVPGMEEILRVQDYLKTNRPNSGFVFCQLHSEIALDQQMQVFKRASPGQRKIIISTSIAESSITVPDVKFVVDFCLTKQTFTDEITNYTSLEMCWASKSNLEQRRGRAGRVENGIYYALVSEELYSRFSDFPGPAIYREPLDKVILNAKRICKKMAPKNILSLCLSVPRLNDLERTVIKLKECGALTLYKRNTGDDGRVRMEMSMYDGNLTFSGEIMACLPVDTRLGKLIVMGHAFGRLKEAIIIAAGLSVRKLFASFHQSKLEFYMGKFNYAKGLMCDFEAILTVYWLWKRKQAEWEQMTADLGDKQRSEIRRLEREWAKSSMLDEKKLKDMQKIIDEIEHRLKSSFEIDVQESDYCNDNINREATDENSALDQYYIIKLMCAAAFYPNYFKTMHNDQMETEVMRQLCGKNPKTTIQVKGLEDPAIYHVRLKDIFKACGDKVIMHYDRSKAYVEFSDYYEVNERISSGVYFALFLGKTLRAEKLILPPARSAFHFERLLRIMRYIIFAFLPFS